MSEPFIGQIIQFGGNFTIRGYAMCQGQLLSISQNTALFSLLGTNFGGNGATTFGLPDLRGRSMVGPGQGPGLSNIILGEVAGVENVTLTTNQIPIHTHVANFDGSTSTLKGSNVKAATQAPQPGSLLGRAFDNSMNPTTAIPLIYAPAGSAQTATLGGLNIAGTITVNPTGGSQPHSVRNPYLGVTHLIALEGIYPSRN